MVMERDGEVLGEEAQWRPWPAGGRERGARWPRRMEMEKGATAAAFIAAH